jgi:hypothetical protein
MCKPLRSFRLPTHMTVFWHVTPCSFTEGYQDSGRNPVRTSSHMSFRNVFCLFTELHGTTFHKTVTLGSHFQFSKQVGCDALPCSTSCQALTFGVTFYRAAIPVAPIPGSLNIPPSPPAIKIHIFWRTAYCKQAIKAKVLPS